MQTANRQAADGSVQPYLVIPFQSGEQPHAERMLRVSICPLSTSTSADTKLTILSQNTPPLPLLTDVNTLLNLERADLDSYLKGYGLQSTGNDNGDKTKIGTFIGVNATLLPD